MVKRKNRMFLAALCFLLASIAAPSTGVGDAIPFDFLSRINALAVERSFPPRLYLATQQGLFIATPDGRADDLSRLNVDMTGLAVHPLIPGLLYASGRAGEVKNISVLGSADSGHNWKIISENAVGPTGIISMAISHADPNLIYGLSDKLLVSMDGGKSFEAKSAPPGVASAIAASASNAATVYAATTKGLYVSRDGGASWQSGHKIMNQATAIHAAADGRLYAFIVGVGLIEARPPDLEWKVLSNDFAGHSLFTLAAGRLDASRIYATADTGAIMTSGDGGRTWIGFEGSHLAVTEFIGKGKELYQAKCQECHGVDGVGEKPEDMYAKDEYGFVAPPLNDRGHSWHHSDENLIESILKGSPQNERMIPWSSQINHEGAQSLVAYIKSLWSFQSLACQGGRHMACMGR